MKNPDFNPIINRDSFLSVTMCADAIGRSNQTIYNLIRRGEFQGVLTVGSRILIPRESFDRWKKSYVKEYGFKDGELNA